MQERLTNWSSIRSDTNQESLTTEHMCFNLAGLARSFRFSSSRLYTLYYSPFAVGAPVHVISDITVKAVCSAEALVTTFIVRLAMAGKKFHPQSEIRPLT